MEIKTVQKKYIFVLQKVYGGQEAIDFKENTEITLTPIKPFSDQKLQSNSKKTTVTKNTLAFFDAITNKFKDFQTFINTLGKNLTPATYKEDKSYIGFLNKGYMNTFSLSFNDETLAEIALKADGNKININDKKTIEIIDDFIELIENKDSDFVKKLELYIENDDKNFNLSKHLIGTILAYKTIKKAFDEHCENNQTMDSELIKDLDIFKKEFLERIRSYKNFRELYRFRKQYLHDKEIENQSIPKKEEQVVKKKCRKKFEDVPGQIHFSDILN